MGWAAVIGAGISAYSADRSNKRDNKAAKQAQDAANQGQQVDVTTDTIRNPWAPSDPYRQQGMDAAANMFGQTPFWQQPGYMDPSSTGRKGGRGGSGGSSKPAGPSSTTTGLLGAMNQQSQGGNQWVNQGGDFLAGMLNDPYAGNPLYENAAGMLSGAYNQMSNLSGQQSPYLNATFGAAQNLAGGVSNPLLDQFAQDLYGQYSPQQGQSQASSSPSLPRGANRATNVGGRGDWTGGSGGGNAGGGYKPGAAPVDSAQYIKDILDGKYMSGNPHLDAMIQKSQSGTQEAYQQGLAGLSAAAESAGRYGGGSHQLADAQAAQRFGDTLSGIDTQLRFQDYDLQTQNLMQALGYGTNLDIASMQDQTQRYGIQSSANAAGSAAASASASAQADRELREQLGNRQLLLDAIGGQNQLNLGGMNMGLGMMGDMSSLDMTARGLGAQGALGAAQGMGALASNAGADRLAGLGMIPGYGNFDFERLQDTFGASFGMDQWTNQIQSQANSQANARRQQDYQRQQDQYNRQMQQYQQGWGNLANYMDVINAASGPYGTSTSHEYGTVPGGGGGGYVANQTDPWAAAIQGGLGAWQLAQQNRQSGAQQGSTGGRV